MDPNVLRGLTEAYTAVYDEELRDELEEMADDFAGIEDLSDEEIDAIVEETIDEMIEDGYDFDDVEEIFEEVLSEAKVTTGAGYGADGVEPRKVKSGSAKLTTGSGSRMAAASRLSSAKAAKRAAKVAQVKASVKTKVAQVKAAPGQAQKAAAKKVKDVKQQAHVSAAKYASSRGLMKGAGLKTQSSKGRSELRSAVAKDIKGRIKQKIAKAQVGAYNVARKVGQAASDVAGKAKQSAKNTVAKTKRGIKGAIAGAASKVASGASRLATRMSSEEVEAWVNSLIEEGYDLSQYTWDDMFEIYEQNINESYDLYDIILSHLLDEGYADTQEAAEAIMVNMSEDWREDIMEKTAMAKRGLDEPTIRNTIAKNTGGGESADRASALEKQSTYNPKTDQQRQNYARAQRGAHRTTTSSSPGLRGYGYQSSDPAVKAKQAARGVQRGTAALTPNEKKQLNR
jgi:uncharacterized protein YnzC (UPF0291/DUF896 family)